MSMMSPLRPVSAAACAALIACTAALPLAAGPTDTELGDLAQPLGATLTTEFMDTPLDRVAEFLQRESDLIVVLDSSVTIEDTPISLKADGLTVRKVLDLVALTTDLDWVIEEGVVFISTDELVLQRRVVTESYNLRGLMVHVPDYDNAPEMDLDGALSNTNSGGSAGGGSGGGGGGLFGDDADLRNASTQEEFMEMIVDLIRDSTGADPDLWSSDVFTARTVQGMLIVRATPDVHQQIEQMLTQIDKSLGQMLAVEAHYLVVPRTTIDGLEGGYILSKADCDAFLESIDNGNVRRLGSMRNVCHNGQRIYTFAGENQGFVSDSEPIPDTASADPTLSVARSGVVADLTPTVTYGGEHIEIAVRSDMVHASGIETTPVPVASQVAGDDDIEAGTVGEVRLGLVTQQLMQFRTNARVPAGGGVILAASTTSFEGIDADQFEVILLVRTHILSTDDDEAE